MSPAVTERARADAPEHAAYLDHRHVCAVCLAGGSCYVRDDLMRLADAADWRRIAGRASP